MLTVNDLMTPIPQTVTPETTLRHVIELMKSERCRQLPVLQDGRLVGIITDRDIRLVLNSPLVLRNRWQDDELLDNVVAGSCMTESPLTVTPDTPAYRAARMLSLYKFGALPVEDEGVLVGIITVTDFLDNFAARQDDKVIDNP